MKKTILAFISLLIFTSCGNEEIIEDLGNTEIKSEYKILALGDSLTAGYNLDINDSYPAQLESLLNKSSNNFEVINAGVSGDTSKNLLSRIKIYNDDYDIVLLNIGGNDGLRSLSLEDLKGNIQKIIDNFSSTKIVLFSIDLPINYGSRYRNQLKQVYKEISEENDIYFYGLFFKGINYNTDFLSDGLHPNKNGYKIISKNIYDYLLKNNLIKND